MSKFSKKKSPKIVKYDKCPILPLFQYGLAVAKDMHITADERSKITNICIVQDTEGKVVLKGKSLYITTQYMLDSIQTQYGINFSETRYGVANPKTYTFEDKNHDDVWKGRTHGKPNFTRNVYSNSHYHRAIDKTILALDILFYMKERGKSYISATAEKGYSDAARVNSMLRKDIHSKNLDLRVVVLPFISERFELTRMQNDYLSFHKGRTEICNKIRSCNVVLDLLMNFSSRTTDTGQTLCKIESLFYELGGQAYVS